ncbi:MAG: YkvA family protein [Burkholderiales bacterium]
MGRLAQWAHALKRESLALYYAARDARTPWYAKLLAGAIVAYALSPIDLIPDFIPVLGYLDELLLLPAAIWLALRLVPEQVLAEARQRAEATLERPTSRVAAVVIVAVWIACAVALGAWIATRF